MNANALLIAKSAVVLFFILATDIYCVEEADATRRSMRCWLMILMLLAAAASAAAKGGSLWPRSGAPREAASKIKKRIMPSLCAYRAPTTTTQ